MFYSVTRPLQRSFFSLRHSSNVVRFQLGLDFFLDFVNQTCFRCRSILTISHRLVWWDLVKWGKVVMSFDLAIDLLGIAKVALLKAQKPVLLMDIDQERLDNSVSFIC